MSRMGGDRLQSGRRNWGRPDQASNFLAHMVKSHVSLGAFPNSSTPLPVSTTRRRTHG